MNVLKIRMATLQSVSECRGYE